MRNFLALRFFVVFALGTNACNAKIENTNGSGATLNDKKIEVYYFHFTRRCLTCNTVEKVTENALNEYFSEKVEKGEVVFTSVNLDEEEGKEIGKELEVAAQKLLIVTGDEKVDITNIAFMNARSNPDKLKTKIKETIENMLQ